MIREAGSLNPTRVAGGKVPPVQLTSPAFAGDTLFEEN